MAKSWDNANYTKRREITVQDANIDSNLSQFPLLLVLTDAHAIANADIASKRYAIYDHNGNEMDYEEEAYSEGASYANAKIWVSQAGWTLYASPTGDQNKLWLYYGYDPGSDQDEATGVWDADFATVFHFGETSWDGTSGEVKDSTSNNNDATSYGASVGTGKIGGGAEILESGSGAQDYIATPANSVLNTASQVSVTVWVNHSTADDDDWIFVKGPNGGSNGYSLLRNSATNTYKAIAEEYGTSSSVAVTGGTSASTGTWTHVGFTFIRENGSGLNLYVNGASDASPGDTSAINNDIGTNYSMFIGQYNATQSSAYGFDGVIDEVRVSTTVRSAAWVKFEYYNANEADNEQTWGSEETQPSVGNPRSLLGIGSRLIRRGRPRGLIRRAG